MYANDCLRVWMSFLQCCRIAGRPLSRYIVRIVFTSKIVESEHGCPLTKAYKALRRIGNVYMTISACLDVLFLVKGEDRPSLAKHIFKKSVAIDAVRYFHLGVFSCLDRIPGQFDQRCGNFLPTKSATGRRWPEREAPPFLHAQATRADRLPRKHLTMLVRDLPRTGDFGDGLRENAMRSILRGATWNNLSSSSVPESRSIWVFVRLRNPVAPPFLPHTWRCFQYRQR